MADSNDITQLLSDWQNGDESAMEALAPFIYRELHELAGGYMRSENAGHTLQATALVNEAFMRMVGSEIDYNDRQHFFVLAARMMRRVLVDHARGKGRKKRGDGALHVTVTESVGDAGGSNPMPILALDEALSTLADRDPRAAQLVELVYFSGLSVDDAAKVAGTAASTAYEDLRFARAWIRQAVE